MIKIKIQKSKGHNPIFKVKVKDEDIEKYISLRRALMEGKKIKGNFNYEIPLRFLFPIVNNLNKEELSLDRHSELEFLEFYDDFEEKYYSSFIATPKFMKLWRKENCPNIFKIKIDKENLNISKEIAFKKINITI